MAWSTAEVTLLDELRNSIKKDNERLGILNNIATRQEQKFMQKEGLIY
jgi:hypothetical protein